MDNNLDDILVDNPEHQDKPVKSKRKLLIGLASALLIAVVILATYFVVAQKDEPQGLEVTHAELEKFINNHKEQAKKGQADEEFDKLIAKIHEKDQGKKQDQVADNKGNQANQVANSSQDQTMQIVQPEKQTLIDAKIQELSSSQEAKRESQEVTNQANEKEVKEKTQEPKQVMVLKSKTQEPKQEQKEVKAPTTQVKKEATQEKKTTSNSQPKSAIQTFNTLKNDVSKGFYLQVGVFGGKPNAEFLKKISNYPYQIDKIDQKGKVVHRYLIGPFKTRQQAQVQMKEVAEKVAKPIIVEIR